MTTASFPPAAPLATDSRFLATGADLASECRFYSGGVPLTFNIAVSRVVGELNNPNTDFTLRYPTELIENQIVSSFATLEMPAWDVDHDPDPAVLVNGLEPERDRVVFNGHDIGPDQTVAFLEGMNDTWKMNRFHIPIQFVRFGAPQYGAPPRPGINTVQVYIDVLNRSDKWCTSVQWASLSFRALAPTIVVHGNNSNAAFFSDFGFLDAFVQWYGLPDVPNNPVKIHSVAAPYDASINMPTDTIEAHGTLLSDLIPQIASRFGARHAHLVAHSKGGLDSRDFLERTLPANFGILSLTTIATPHHGSAGADYLAFSVGASAAYSNNPTRVSLAQLALLKGTNEGNPDLMTDSATKFNLHNEPALHGMSLIVDGERAPVQYFSVSDDADLDSNGVLAPNEVIGMHQPVVVTDQFWAGIMTQLYTLMGTVASATAATSTATGTDRNGDSREYVVNTVAEAPSTCLRTDGTTVRCFKTNDILVTVESARLPDFQELASVKANHATVANPAVGRTVLDNIKAVQPVNPAVGP